MWFNLVAHQSLLSEWLVQLWNSCPSNKNGSWHGRPLLEVHTLQFPKFLPKVISIQDTSTLLLLLRSSRGREKRLSRRWCRWGGRGCWWIQRGREARTSKIGKKPKEQKEAVQYHDFAGHWSTESPHSKLLFYKDMKYQHCRMKVSCHCPYNRTVKCCQPTKKLPND